MSSVIVCVWDHKSGTDIAAFATWKAAQAWKDHIGETWFEKEFPDEEKPKTDVGDRYFELMGDYGDEWFIMEECDVEEERL